MGMNWITRCSAQKVFLGLTLRCSSVNRYGQSDLANIFLIQLKPKPRFYAIEIQ